MNHNLARPYEDTCSPPQSPYLSFSTPQSHNYLFTTNDVIELSVQSGIRSIGLRWSLHRNMVKKPFRKGVADAHPDNRFDISLDTSDLLPGFYDLRVELDTGIHNQTKDKMAQRPVRGVCTFGWRVEEMPLADSRPKDFNAFWEAAKATLADISLDAEEETLTVFGPEEIATYNLNHAALPADYDPQGHRAETVESGKVSFAGPDGGRVYGWLAKPEGDGPFPAMLVLPGAGFDARPRPLEQARHGYVALDIQVHGQDVDLKTYKILPGYNDGQIFDPVTDYYYYKVHLRCLQAVSYLASRPDVDPNRIVVVGGSQGGRLGIVTAGLDPRIKAVVSCITNSPNQPHLSWVAHCNDQTNPKNEPSDGMELTGPPPVLDDAQALGMAYYDPMNFAPDIHCPVLMNAGLIDPVSPPFSPWAVYQRLGTEQKTFIPIPGHGHDWFPEFDRRAWSWLDQVLGK